MKPFAMLKIVTSRIKNIEIKISTMEDLDKIDLLISSFEHTERKYERQINRAKDSISFIGILYAILFGWVGKENIDKLLPFPKFSIFISSISLAIAFLIYFLGVFMTKKGRSDFPYDGGSCMIDVQTVKDNIIKKLSNNIAKNDELSKNLFLGDSFFVLGLMALFIAIIIHLGSINF